MWLYDAKWAYLLDVVLHSISQNKTYFTLHEEKRSTSNSHFKKQNNLLFNQVNSSSQNEMENVEVIFSLKQKCISKHELTYSGKYRHFKV